MDDLFQGLLSTGRGPIKTSALSEALDAPDHTPFGAVFSLVDPSPEEVVPAPISFGEAQSSVEPSVQVAPQGMPGTSLSALPEGATSAPVEDGTGPSLLSSIKPQTPTSDGPNHLIARHLVQTMPGNTTSATPLLNALDTTSPDASRNAPVVPHRMQDQPILGAPNAPPSPDLSPVVPHPAPHSPPSVTLAPTGATTLSTSLELENRISFLQGDAPVLPNGNGRAPTLSTGVVAPEITQQAVGVSPTLQISGVEESRSHPASERPSAIILDARISNPATSVPLEPNTRPDSPAESPRITMVPPPPILARTQQPQTATAIGNPSDRSEPTTMQPTRVPLGQETPQIQAAMPQGVPPASPSLGASAQQPLPQAPLSMELSDRVTLADRPDRASQPNVTSSIAPSPSASVSFVQLPSQILSSSTPAGDLGIEQFVSLQTANIIQPTGPLPTAPGFTPPPNAPTLVAQQIAAALHDRGSEPGQPIELALDPPELGRVRMQMAELAGVLTLTIQAERPETAELMRRHLDLLAQEFADAGIDAPSVRISQDGSGSETSDRDASASTATIAEDDAPAPTPFKNARSHSGALDLRL